MEFDLISSNAIEGEIGPEALGGYIAFPLYKKLNNDDEKTDASYLVVATLTGEIISFTPTYPVVGASVHFDAIKPIDGDSFLVNGNDHFHEDGQIYRWYWRTGILEKVCGHTANLSSHDSQWSTLHEDPAFWVPTKNGMNLYKAHSTESQRGGEVMIHHRIFDRASTDINHAQLIEYETGIVLSIRTSSSIVYYNVSADTIEWILGGETNTLDLYNLHGQKLTKPGASLFYGQHNAEYVGNNLYYLFDNNYHPFARDANNSRLLIVEIDPTANTAREVWEYILPGYAEVFGDNDRLPSTNMLSCWWPRKITQDVGIFDEQIFEIVQDTKQIVWSLKINGVGCDFSKRDFCVRTPEIGWKVYSVERFYESPLVYNIKCSAGTLSFATQDIFKTNDAKQGFFALVIGDKSSSTTLASGSFEFLPYWAQTTVSTTFNKALISGSTDVSVRVTNSYGKTSIISTTCSSV